MSDIMHRVRDGLVTVLRIYGPSADVPGTYEDGHPIALCRACLSKAEGAADTLFIEEARQALTQSISRFVMLPRGMTPAFHPVMRIWQGIDAAEEWLAKEASRGAFAGIEQRDLLDLVLAANAWGAVLHGRPLNESVASASCVGKAVTSLSVMAQGLPEEETAERLAEAVWRAGLPPSRATDPWPDGVIGGSVELLRGQARMFMDVLEVMRLPRPASALARTVRRRVLAPLASRDETEEGRAAIMALIQAAALSDIVEEAGQGEGDSSDGP